MADIRSGGWEWLHYDEPDFQVMYRVNEIPAGCALDDIAMHWHDDVEFMYVTEGKVYHYLGDEKLCIHKGEGLFINARQKHLIASSEENAKLCCLIFHPIILCGTEYIAQKCVLPLINDAALSYVVLKETVAWQKTLLDTLADMAQYVQQEAGHIQMMRSIYEIWDLLFQNLIAIKQKKEETNADIVSVNKMVSFIHEMYRNKIKLSEICKAGNVGKTKCNELFDLYYNVTPMEYLRNYRLSKGASLLEITDMSITDIAYEVGFSDGSYFSKMFSQQIGCTPQKYRSYGKGMSKYYEQSRYSGIPTSL